jgi:hypothetical protein
MCFTYSIYLYCIDVAQSLYAQSVINLDLPVETFLHRVKNHMRDQAQVVGTAIPSLESQFIKHKFTIEIG